MSKRAFIGLDQGTRSTKCLLVAESGEVLSTAKRMVGLLNQGQGQVAQDPHELLQSVREVLAEVRAFADLNQFEVAAIGLATQRSGVCAWSLDDGVVLHPLINWADTRFKAQIDSLADKSSYISDRTLLPVLPNYAAPKVAHLQKAFPENRIAIGTLDSFLCWHLDSSRPFITDDTMAARTLLYDIYDHCWSSNLCDIFAVNISRLAQVLPSIAEHGTIDSIPCFARIGDQQAALYALRQYDADIVLNLGSIASLAFSTGATPLQVKGFPGSILVSRDSPHGVIFEHLLEGITNAAAQVVDTLIQKQFISDSSQIDGLCGESINNGARGTLFLPLGSTASPHWRYDLPPVVLDCDGVSAADYVRAAVENIAGFIIYQIEHLKAATLIPSKVRLVVAGGLAQSSYLLQFLSACLGDTILVAEIGEATAYGAARAACDGFSQCAMPKWPTPARTIAESLQMTKARLRYDRWCKILEKGLHERD